MAPKSKSVRSNPKNVKVNKDTHINVRCTQQQKDLIESIASRDGLAPSTWLLQLGLRAIREEQKQEARA